MPITQPRLLRLLEAAEHYQVQYRAFYNSIYQLCAAIARKSMTTEQAFTEITDQLTLMGQYTVHDSIISEERTRYQLTHSRNATERLRQSYRRALEGRQPLPTGPVGHQAPPRPTRPLTGPSHQPPPSPEAARALAIANLDDDAFEALADLGDDPPDTSPHPMSLPDDFEPATPADIQAAIARTLAAKDPT